MDFDQLSRRGYFTDILPNIFSTISFGDWVEPRLATYSNLKDRSRHCRYNASKRNGQRRIFSVPNPLTQFNAHVFFKKHEKEIVELANDSPQSLSKPEQSEKRCVKITPHPLVDQARFKKLSEFKNIVYIDFSRYYHSIYTHSLPWAAHGKQEAKLDSAPDSKNLFFNRIDAILRNGQDGQTLGIPVGPDISRVLAEIINAAIDKHFSIENPDAVFLRHVDDVWIGANSEAEAKELLHAYRENIRHFELDINDTKSSIRSNHLNIIDFWPSRVQSLLVEHLESKGEHAKVSTFLNLVQFCFDEAQSRQDEAIVRLLLRKLDEQGIWQDNTIWSYVEGFLLQCTLHFPHTIDYVARVVAWRSILKLDFDRPAWARVFKRLIEEHSQVKNDSEVTWVLWCCLKSGIKLSSELAMKVFHMRCDFSAIEIFLLEDAKLIEGKINKAEIAKLFEIDDTLGPNWLLAHEVRVNKWLPANYLKTNSDSAFLKELRDANISFLKPDMLPPVFFDENGDVKEDFQKIRSAIEDTNDAYDDADVEDDEAALIGYPWDEM